MVENKKISVGEKNVCGVLYDWSKFMVSELKGASNRYPDILTSMIKDLSIAMSNYKCNPREVGKIRLDKGEGL